MTSAIPFYCVSFYYGDLAWLPAISQGNYHIYAVTPVDDVAIDPQKITSVPHVGYNVNAYMRYIVDHYDSLPDRVLFCKDNVFPRHVSRQTFERLAARPVFTPIEEPGQWNNRYPISMRSSDNGYLELNNSWYVKSFVWRYFATYDDFHSFIFDDQPPPKYIRFAPGANYVVPREHILLRSRSFYFNLMQFCDYDPHPAESHMIERALHSIWTTTAEESPAMSDILSEEKLRALANSGKQRRGSNTVRRIRQRAGIELTAAVDRLIR